MDGDVFRKIVSALFEANNLDVVCFFCKLFDPSMEKSQDRVVQVYRLCGYEEPHAPILARLFTIDDLRTVNAFDEIQVFIGLEHELNIFLLRSF
jgi:hypothetical protein